MSQKMCSLIGHGYPDVDCEPRPVRDCPQCRIEHLEQENARLRQALNAISENIPQEEFDAYVRLAEEIKG